MGIIFMDLVSAVILEREKDNDQFMEALFQYGANLVKKGIYWRPIPREYETQDGVTSVRTRLRDDIIRYWKRTPPCKDVKGVGYLEEIFTGPLKVSISWFCRGHMEFVEMPVEKLARFVWSENKIEIARDAVPKDDDLGEVVSVTASWNVPGAFWEKMKKKFLLGLAGKQIPIDFSKGRSFPKLIGGVRSIGAQRVEHAIYESQ
jgi:hypothetical protein